MKEAADEVLAELGIENDPLLAIAKRLEEIALSDEYFIEKKLYPNVDFYSGHHPQGHRHSHQHVHRDLRRGPHRGLDCPLERNDQRQLPDRAPAPAVHRVYQRDYVPLDQR